MIRLRLRAPPQQRKGKVKAGKIFLRALKGYKLLMKRGLIKGPMPKGGIVQVGGPVYPFPAFPPKTPEVKVEHMEIEKGRVTGEEEEQKGIPLEQGAVVKLEFPAATLKNVNIIYSLIPAGSKHPFASANIRWSSAENALTYNVIEPELTQEEKKLLEEIKTVLVEKLDIDFATLRKGEARIYLLDRFKEMITLMGKTLTEEKQEQFLYYLERDFIGLGKIEPMMQDPNIEDISCDGIGIPMFVFHRNPLFGSIRTNIFFSSADELDIFAHKLAQRVGKTVSVATPLIGGALPDGSRLQVTLGTDIARKGSNFTIRKFTEKPLTSTHLLKTNTINARMLSYLWLAIEYGRSILITGGVATGKTTLLNVLSLFIKPEYKVVSIEDSVTGDSEIVINKDNKYERTTIGKLVDEQIEKYGRDIKSGREWCTINPELTSVFTLTSDGKILLAPISSFIRHKVRKDILEIKTRTGRNIKVTGDHSLFGLDGHGNIEPVEARKLTKGDFIAAPRYLPFDTGGIHSIKLINCLEKLDDLFVSGEKIKSIERDRFLKAGISKNNVGYYKVKGIVPNRVLSKMLKNGYLMNETEGLSIKTRRSSKKLPIEIRLDEDFLTFMGLWLAEGSYDKNSIIISSLENECREIIRKAASKLDLITRLHSDNVSLMLHSSALKKIMQNILELKGNAYTKIIPSWMFNLNNRQIAYVLKGYFSGDGHVSKSEIEASSSSIKLLKGIQTLLLRYGIISRIGSFKKRDKTYRMRISSTEALKKFSSFIGFLQDFKNSRLDRLCSRKNTHDSTDIIPLSKTMIKMLDKAIGGFNTNSYYFDSNVGRNKLLEYSSRTATELTKKLSILANSDVLWDEILSVNNLGVIEDYVYDLSVPIYENFICENVVAHNTPELKLPHPHWVPGVARQPITEVEGKKLGEVDLFDLLRESLRQRPDYLIVGEVRGKEAYVLFQQIATGHSSMSTIHADSMQRLMDRLTTPPISLPPNLIEALDIIIFIQRFKYGNNYIRRVMHIYEIAGFDRKANYPIVNEVFRWNPKTDKFDTINPSIMLKKISIHYGVPETTLRAEVAEREKVIQWMFDKNIIDYRDVARIIKIYYTRPQDLLGAIE